MILAHLVAMDDRGGIGKDGKIPWHISTDLRNFKALTMGSCVIVGRKTWEAMDRALKGRRVILITRDPNYAPKHAVWKIAHSIEWALAETEAGPEEEVYVIGGAEIYAATLDRAHFAKITKVRGNYNCTELYPVYNMFPGWEKIAEGSPTHFENGFFFRFEDWRNANLVQKAQENEDINQ